MRSTTAGTGWLLVTSGFSKGAYFGMVIATLFQPALKEKTPPLVRAFIEAAAEMAV
jgi:hypothetical protein